MKAKIEQLLKWGYEQEKIDLAISMVDLLEADYAYDELVKADEIDAASCLEYLFLDFSEEDQDFESYFDPADYLDTDGLIADQFDTDITYPDF